MTSRVAGSFVGRWRARWRAWVRFCAETERPTSMALVRIGVGLVLACDFALVWSHGVGDVLWGPSTSGAFGLADTLPDAVPVHTLFGASLTTSRAVHAVAFGSALCLSLGLFSRTSALVAFAASSQLAAILPQADRGIDTMLRMVLLLLAASGAGQALSIDAWRRHRTWRPDVRVLAWPRRFLVLQVLWMYFSAGLHKSQLAWWPAGDFAALYVVLLDPHFARADFSGWLSAVYPLTQLGTASTMLFEVGAPLMGLSLWFRRTSHRGGRWRATFAKLRVREVWLALGIGFHVALMFTIRLGIFPYGMLALYWAFLTPAEVEALFARLRRRPSS
ncbi:MAG: HTTM domain-containing protein [Sandaracinus sp.]|nr:HTTM domain-containing protein [Sandaracinus sp.]MCB9612363.1 HTTM domain-containing protein [Sandaracinus sp.]MCB9624227.1 HTTM domain-containing protein [Sandaracinus sp.]MCB9633493.1 HTTM domain-containing protein [Sandaracinus sp.]